MSLKVDLRVGETLTFNNGQIVVTLLEKSGQRARISVEADDSVLIQPPSRESPVSVCDHNNSGKKMGYPE